MSLFHRKDAIKDRGSVKAPSYDPYERFKNTGDGLFGFRKDKHVIMPGVTSYEERALEGVKKYVERETQKPCTLSTELINDVYSVYVNKDVKRRPETSDNTIRHQVIDKVYDSLTKVVTEDSPLYTQILTRELAMVLQKVDDEMKEEQQKQNGDGEGDGQSEGLESTGAGDSGSGDGNEEGQGQAQGEGDGEGDSKGTAGDPNSSSTGAGKDSGTGNRESASSELAKDLLDKASDEIEKAKSNADNKIKDLEDQLGKEAMKDLMNTNPEFLEEIDDLKDNLKKVSINKDSIRKVMEKILNESMNYFSSKFKVVEESLFDCEECEDLFGLEYLHPIFRNAELMNVGNETRIYKGKIDLFLDCSSSMNSKEYFEGTAIRMIDLAKGIAMVLYRMGMIENLYFFDGGLYEIKNANEISILSFSKTGGTNFNNVVAKIKQNGNNSVIITDGYDSCASYTKQAFWIGIGGTTFDRNDAFQTYRSTGQCVAYNSGTSKFDYCR